MKQNGGSWLFIFLAVIVGVCPALGVVLIVLAALLGLIDSSDLHF